VVNYLPATPTVNIDSGSETSFTASLDTYYIIDTASAAVTVTLPVGADSDGHWVIIQNSPAGGYQVGGTVAGNSITIQSQSSEDITTTGTTSESLGPPTSTVTAACRRYFPTGANSGTGSGQAGITGWDTN